MRQNHHMFSSPVHPLRTFSRDLFHGCEPVPDILAPVAAVVRFDFAHFVDACSASDIPGAAIAGGWGHAFTLRGCSIVFPI